MIINIGENMENNKLIVLNQNSELALLKSRNLLDITKKILNNKELIQFFNFKPLLKEKGHSSYVKSIAISPDGKYIVSGSGDETIKIWDFKNVNNIYSIDLSFNISINNEGFFKGNIENIDKYIRVSEKPLTIRKLIPEEINHFTKKESFL